MVYGMNPVLGPISFSEPDEGSIDKPFSERTGELIDIEVRKLVSRAMERTTALLKERSKELATVAEMLLEKEKLRMEDLESALGAKPHRSTFLEDIKYLLPDEWRDDTGAVKEQHIIDSERRKNALEREGLSPSGTVNAPPQPEVAPAAEGGDPNKDGNIEWGFFPRSKSNNK